MGIFGKKKTEKVDKAEVTGICAQLEKARHDFATKQQEYDIQCNLYAERQQEVNKIKEDCKILYEQNRKRRKRAVVICILFIVLGIGVNFGIYMYADNELNNKKVQWQREYDEKKAAIEQKIDGNHYEELIVE